MPPRVITHGISMNALAINSPSLYSSPCSSGSFMVPLIVHEEVKLTADSNRLTLRITRLLQWRSPSAVARLVVAIVVDAVNAPVWLYAPPSRWVGGPFTHVRKKVLKDLPTITNSDSATTIAVVKLILRSIAPRLHGRPRIVNCRSVKAMSFISGTDLGASFRAGSTSPLSHQATTTTGFATREQRPSRSDGSTAVANAHPVHVAVRSASECSNDNESSESLARQVHSSNGYGAASRAFVVQVAHATSRVTRRKAFAVVENAGGRLKGHLELILSGVTRAAVTAVRPSFYFTRLGAQNGCLS